MSVLKTTIKDLRRINRSTVLQHVYLSRPISRLEISQISGLSPATVTNMVMELLEEGIVQESGQEESQGGRPRTILTINKDYGVFIGVDLGETHIQLELFDLTMRKREAIRQELSHAENAPPVVIGRISDGIGELLRRARAVPGDVIGVGVGVPGLVERSREARVFAPEWGWQNVPLAAELKRRLGLPIFVDNGAKAMTLAEMLFGAGRGAETLAVLLVGTGVGAGVITSGALYRGATNSAGEWGHTTIQLEGRSCRCGSRGCLEAYLGAPGIVATLRERSPDSPLLAHDGEMATIQALVAAARDGDRTARGVLSTTAYYLGVGMANLVNLFNPQMIVLGGWAGLEIGELILPEVAEVARRHALRQPFEAVTMGLCQLGQDAVCMGAASLVLEEFLSASSSLGSLKAMRVSSS